MLGPYLSTWLTWILLINMKNKVLVYCGTVWFINRSVHVCVLLFIQALIKLTANVFRGQDLFSYVCVCPSCECVSVFILCVHRVLLVCVSICVFFVCMCVRVHVCVCVRLDG